jgi:hypothetical protein
MDPRTIEQLRRGIRLGLLIALFLALMFLAGAAIPYACQITYVPEARLEQAERDIRAKMKDLGRSSESIEAAVDELHRSYRAKEETDG